MLPHRNTVILNRLKHEFENGKNWVCFPDPFPDDLVEQLEDLGYSVKIGDYISPPDGSRPFEVRTFEYEERYREEYKCSTVVFLF